MIGANDLRPGMTIELNGEIFSCTEFQHIKPGKGGAFVRLKLKNFSTGAVIDKTVRPEEKFPLIRISRKPMQYLYQEGGNYYFMDTESYEQFGLSKDMLSSNVNYLKENMEVTVLFHDETIIGIELPVTIELKVITTEPGFKGNTVSGATKQAELETGLKVQVPLFVEEGEILKIDTRTGEYIERVRG
ncbi:MAG: elongation factor P [bacterium]